MSKSKNLFFTLLCLSLIGITFAQIFPNFQSKGTTTTTSSSTNLSPTDFQARTDKIAADQHAAFKQQLTQQLSAIKPPQPQPTPAPGNLLSNQPSSSTPGPGNATTMPAPPPMTMTPPPGGSTPPLSPAPAAPMTKQSTVYTGFQGTTTNTPATPNAPSSNTGGNTNTNSGWNVKY